MNFTELMNQAAQNKQRAAKQYAQKRQGQALTADSQGVSSAAVKAFLLRKEKEEKQKQVEQEKARKLRIQARLEQSINSKKGRKKSTEDITTNDSSIGKERTRPSGTVLSARETEKKRISNNTVANKRPYEPPDNHTSSTMHRNKEANNRLQHRDRHTLNATATKNGNKEVTKQPGPSVTQQPAVGVSKQGSSAKSKKSSTKLAAPVDFRELLAMAEKNKNCPPGAISGLVDKRTSAKRNVVNSDVDSSGPSAAKDKKNSVRDSRNGKLDREGVNAVAKISMKNGPVHLQSASKEKLRGAKMDEHIKPKMPNHKVTDVQSRSLPKASSYDMYKPAPGPSWRSVQGHHDPHLNHKRGRSMDRMYDNDDGMDDFIDDEGEDMDVSKYIRDIFGYDRTRYNDTEEDCSFMESNFSQIEREESRSAKIAKLEDEVEFLKEQAELKKQKQALMKQRKKK